MKRGSTLQFLGNLGEYIAANGNPCSGRTFCAKQVGVGGVYLNTVECTTCQKELPAGRRRWASSRTSLTVTQIVLPYPTARGSQDC